MYTWTLVALHYLDTDGIVLPVVVEGSATSGHPRTRPCVLIIPGHEWHCITCCFRKAKCSKYTWTLLAYIVSPVVVELERPATSGHPRTRPGVLSIPGH